MFNIFSFSLFFWRRNKEVEGSASAGVSRWATAKTRLVNAVLTV